MNQEAREDIRADEIGRGRPSGRPFRSVSD
jgi:hypothetical protein